MDLATLMVLQKFAYLIATVLLCIFLYAYIFSMYKSEKKGTRNYEQYSRLALDDALDDKIIEKRKH